MIDRVRIENFRCFREVDVPLKPLTVLIGQNDTGKTAFLDAVESAMGMLLATQTPSLRVLQSGDTFLRDASLTVAVEIDSERQRYGVRAVPGKNSRQWQLAIEPSRQPTASGAFIRNESQSPPSPGREAWVEKLLPVARFQLPVTGLQLQCGGLKDAELMTKFNGDRAGNFLPAVLDYILRNNRRSFMEMERRFCEQVPGLESFNVSTPDPSQRRIDFHLENGLVLQPPQVSAGVRLLLFFTTLAYMPNPPRTLLIEEPECGVHPSRLAEIASLFHSVSRGEFGPHPTQVFVTTHSPYLLDHMDIDTDQILVCSRNGDGSRAVEPADADRLKLFLDEYQLGEVWFNQSEAGMVAKEASA